MRLVASSPGARAPGGPLQLGDLRRDRSGVRTCKLPSSAPRRRRGARELLERSSSVAASSYLPMWPMAYWLSIENR